MEEIPAISVVVAAYNHGRYIGETIRSVLEQTFEDFEIIVLDDGSTDNTRDIVLSFTDKRVRYFYQENSGLPACGRNRGMSFSRGGYISLLDGDDVWHRDKLKKCKSVLDEMADVDLVCHNESIVYDNKVLRVTSYGPYTENMYSKLLFGGNCLHSSAVMIRRSVFFDDNYRFCEAKDLFTVEDYEYWLRLSKKYRFYFLSDVLGSYLVTESGAFLSASESNAVNTLYLLERHFTEFTDPDNSLRLKIRKRKASVMAAAGRMYMHNRNFDDGRRWYLRALREYPFNYKALIGYAAALCRFRIIYR